MKILDYGRAICYSGYRHGQSPMTVAPSKDEIKEDLEILVKDGYRYLRMYDPNVHAERVLELIKENNYPLQCMIGVDNQHEINNPNCTWNPQHASDEELAAHAARNDAEVEKLIALVNRFPEQVCAVSIGNENTPSWGEHTVSEDRLIQHARRLREGTGKPVTFNEGFFEWPKLARLAEEMDFISVHSYPWHYGNTIDEAVAVNKEHYEKTCQTFPGKQVLFTEIGWSTMPNDVSKGANEENQGRYTQEVLTWLDKEQIIGFLFEAFDEPWKAPKPEGSEAHWGLYDVSRKAKAGADAVHNLEKAGK